MIEISDKKKCCGCFACYNVCPVDAIEMVTDTEGFKYPLVDDSKCISCDQCINVCPIINVDKEKVNPNQQSFLVQIRDEKIRHESTSGGAFTAISTWVLNQGGVVYGACLDIEKREVFHTFTDNFDGLSEFRNSKYVQSNINKTFTEIKEFLKNGRWVCFSGTPCQIEGLKKFLKKDYDTLLTIDVVCYGIPSPGIFMDYVNYQNQKIGGKFVKFLFREKRLCYNYTSVSIFNENPKLNYHKGVESDKFMRSFFSNLNVRPSCYDCKFKKQYRVSDFTIWDCYDVSKFSSNFDDKGTNRVLVHSVKALKIFDEIKDSIKFERYHNISYFVKDERAMVESITYNKLRTSFFEDYKRMCFHDFINKWFPDSFSVRLNSLLRMLAFRLGLYNQAKKIVKKILNK